MAKGLKNTPVSGPTDSDGELKGIMDSLTYAQRDDLLKMLQQDKKERNRPSFESLFGNEKAILENIKENCLTVTWDATYDAMGFSDKVESIGGRVVKLDLPAVGDFKGFKIELFISRDVSYIGGVAGNDKTREKLCPREKLEDILRAINGYMRAYGVVLDENVDFNGDLEGVPCKTWEYVKDLLRVGRGWLRGEKTKFGSKLLNFTLYSDRNGGKKVYYGEPYYYDDPESDSIPPSNSLIVLLSD